MDFNSMFIEHKEYKDGRRFMTNMFAYQKRALQKTIDKYGYDMIIYDVATDCNDRSMEGMIALYVSDSVGDLSDFWDTFGKFEKK